MMAPEMPYTERGSRARAARALLLACACALALGACGSGGVQKVGMVRTDASDAANIIRLSRAVSAALPDKTAVDLPAASRWLRVGALPQGDVYRSADAPFTLPGHRSEACMVASSGKLLGVYLPGDSLFMPLSRPVTLPVSMRQ
ncbi:hypothetical protein [Achromobacter anxifer]|uniref:hypothetical protein n=1 Tax=Achromobacter anxifer TaxID=1287737 RepID=UPI00215767E8|nr:hypothetical protein [Achromobacter anxifer]